MAICSVNDLDCIMHLVLMFLVALTIAATAYHFWQRVPRLARLTGGWGSPANDDPRLAIAAMLVAVATEDGPMRSEEERLIVSMLSGTVGLDEATARTCRTGGRRLAARVHGDLNSRLHQLKPPVERHCSRLEKEQAVDMLRTVAGPSADSVHSVREGLGRLAATLLNG